jgi:PPM family protein phosphatase
VGARDETEVEVGERTLADGDLLLLCSDGLHGTIGDAGLRAAVAAGGDVVAIAERLVNAALDKHASDNVTALVVQYHA